MVAASIVPELKIANSCISQMIYNTLLLYSQDIYSVKLVKPVRALWFVAVCMHKYFIQGCRSAQAHPNNHCHAHTVDYIHGLGQG